MQALNFATIPDAELDTKGQGMKHQDKDTWGNIVDWNVVMSSWLTSEEAAEIMKVTQQSVNLACQHKRVRAIQIVKSSAWRIEPTSAREYEKRIKD